MRITIIYSSIKRVDFRAFGFNFVEDLYNTNNRTALKAQKYLVQKILSKGIHKYVSQTFALKGMYIVK